MSLGKNEREIKRFINNRNKTYGFDSDYEYESDDEQFYNQEYDRIDSQNIVNSNYCCLSFSNDDKTKIDRLKYLEELIEDSTSIKNMNLWCEYKDLCESLGVKIYYQDILKKLNII